MKKALITVLLSAVVLIAACKPEGVIPPDEMSSLLAELYLTDACLEMDGQKYDGIDSLEVYLPVIEAGGFTKDEFNASIEYYLRHQSDFEKIFKKVQKKLELKGNSVLVGDAVIDTLESDVQPPELRIPDETPADSAQSLVVDRVSGEGQTLGNELPLPAEKNRRSVRKKISKKDVREIEEKLK